MRFAPQEVRFVDDQEQIDHYYNPNPGDDAQEGNYVNSARRQQAQMVTTSIPAGYAARVVASKAAGTTMPHAPSSDLPPDMAEFSEALPEATPAHDVPF